MKRRVFCRAAAACLAAGALGTLPAAAEGTGVGRRVPEGMYPLTFRSDRSMEDVVHEFYYSDAMFDHSALEYDHALATVTLGLVTAAGNTVQSDRRWWETGDAGRQDNIADAFQQLGFEDCVYPGYQQDLNTMETEVGCALGRKVLWQKGKPVTIVAMMLRGLGYGMEWVSNLEVGSGTEHAGFVGAVPFALEALKDYLQRAGKKNRLGTIKLWLGGYSRGAVVANLLAGKIRRELPGILQENTFVYTFASPAALTAADCPEMQAEFDNNHGAEGTLKDGWDPSNIFNMISSGDVVSRVLPEQWGYHRNGNDRFLPSTLRAEELAELDERGRNFGTTALVFSDLATCEDTDALLEAALKFFGTKQEYHQNYEAAFKDMLRCFCTRTREEIQEGKVMDEEEVVNWLRSMDSMKKFTWGRVLGCVLAASAMSRAIQKRLGDDLPIHARQIILPTLAVGLCYNVETDALKMMVYYLASLVSVRGQLDNVLRVVYCHFPENYIALMEYYAPADHGMEPCTRS